MRKRLALTAAATTSMVVLAFVLPLAMLVRDMASERAMSKATLEAQSLVSVLTAVDATDRATVVQAYRQRTTDQVSVYLPDGTVLGAPSTADGGVAEAMRGKAFTRDRDGTREVLAPLVTGGGDALVVRIAVPRDRLGRGVKQAWELLAAVALVLMAIAVMLADRLARSIVRPIGDLAATATRLETGDLEARAAPGGPPEVEEVGHALNGLAQRILDLVAAERESLADLSHRLRTPLTALRLEAESIHDPADADRISAVVDGLAGAVDDLISEARRPSAALPERADAGQVVEERVAFWSALADEQGRTVNVRIDPALPPVPLSPVALADVVDALIGNVFAHTPEGTAFAITLRQAGSLVTLAFDDAGPGFGDADVLRRGVSGAGSTGLGLDIARRVVEGAGGTLDLDRSQLGGGRVELLIPIGRSTADDTPRRGWLRRAKTPVGA